MEAALKSKGALLLVAGALGGAVAYFKRRSSHSHLQEASSEEIAAPQTIGVDVQSGTEPPIGVDAQTGTERIGIDSQNGTEPFIGQMHERDSSASLQEPEKGDCVELRDLVSAAHLNGSVCVLESWDSAKGRWGVRHFATHKLLSIAPSKLLVLSCRICWSSTMDEATGPLLSPCACRGSSAYAHLGCLKQWAVCESNIAGKSHTPFVECPVCEQDYTREAGIELLRENLRWEEGRAAGTRYLSVTVHRLAEDRSARWGWGFGIAGVPHTGAILYLHGALVTDVFEGTPAAAAGIEADDLIVSVNGRPVTPTTSNLRDLSDDGDSALSLELGVVRKPRVHSPSEKEVVAVHAELGVGGQWKGSNGMVEQDDGALGPHRDNEWISEDELSVRYTNRVEQVNLQREQTLRLQAQRAPEEYLQLPYVKLRVRAVSYRMMDMGQLQQEMLELKPGVALARAYSELSKQLAYEGDLKHVPEAIALGRKAVGMCEQICGEDEDTALDSIRPLAAARLNLAAALCQLGLHTAGNNVLLSQGALSEAEPLAHFAIRNIEQRAVSDDRERNNALAPALNILGGILNLQSGRQAEAEAVVRRQLACSEAAYGPEHLSTASCLTNLGNLISAQRRDRASQEEARELATRGRAVMVQLLGETHPHLAQPTNGLALIHKHLGEASEAEALLRALLVQIAPSLSPTHPQVGSSELQLALLLRDTGRHDEAQRWWVRPGAVAFRRMGRMPSNLQDTTRSLGC